MADTFTCAVCHGTFVKKRSDTEAAAESADLFPPEELAEGSATVCEDCWQNIRRTLPDFDARVRATGWGESTDG